ncbi:unnamed protein product [Linum trigynum]|uniref:Uncharacterized protein n=1 Tax=Linum trigynum TaxID=586398 RepID=A0AAV2EJ38_9ROSI
MDLSLQIIPISTFFFFFLTIIVSFPLIKRRARAHKKTGHRRSLAPSAGRKLPVIGHLHHFLTTRQLPHRLLRELSRRHGDVMSLDLGEIPHVVISSAAAAMEVMRTHDVKFAQRPPHPHQAKVMYGGVNLIQAPYGDYWRQLRRIATLELLTAKRVDSLRRVRESEVLALVRSVVAAGTGTTTVNLTRMLYDFNIPGDVRGRVGGARGVHQGSGEAGGVRRRVQGFLLVPVERAGAEAVWHGGAAE